KKIQSNKRGYFKTTLPPGHYSLLIQEGEKLWGNQFNEHMIINPFTVIKHQVIEFNVEINHSAYF
ncbi:MAG: carboxypeptidase regulatory-like domain-containing protein, partial [Chryseotalea sp.]